jgi:NAD(P)-dependent dehydrogenase (short-subunit alcohol dehydrogenase family)
MGARPYRGVTNPEDNMKIAIIGASGTIGQAVADAFEARGDEVVRLSRSSACAMDIEDPASIKSGLDALGEVDAIISTAGRAAFGPLTAQSDEDFALGIRSKLEGQVNLVRFGEKHLKPGGAFVLTSGILSRAPWPNTAAVAMVNGGIESFARAAALDLEGKRIEVVSPPLVKETAVAMGMGDAPAPSAAEVAEAYLAAVDGSESGVTRFVDGHAPG